MHCAASGRFRAVSSSESRGPAHAGPTSGWKGGVTAHAAGTSAPLMRCVFTASSTPAGCLVPRATLHPGLTGGDIYLLATAHAGLAQGPGSAATQAEGAAAARATESMCRQPRRRPPQGSHRRGYGSGAGVGAGQTGCLAPAPNGAARGLPPQVVLTAGTLELRGVCMNRMVDSRSPPQQMA